MFSAHGVGKKEADSFTPAHRKKHNELNTHTHTHTATQGHSNTKPENDEK